MKKKEKGTRTGFTTGACSAAAARAAMTAFVAEEVPEKIESLLPNGERVSFAVAEGSREKETARAVIIKDAGDDPDCTDKAPLTATLRLIDESIGQVIIKGGPGVGVVTKPGLGLPLDQAAINPVPRKNIEENIREVAGPLLDTKGVEVTISVPGGEEMARKTLNGRLGIVGGISILGTTGIVRPYSTAAFRESVVQAVEVAACEKVDTVVLTTGGRTETFAMRELPHLSPAAFIQMGDFLGPALKALSDKGIGKVIIGAMVGKLTKIAQGEKITHANKSSVNMELLADIARSAGASPTIAQKIKEGTTARFASELLEEQGLVHPFYEALARRAGKVAVEDHPGKFSVKVMVCDFEGNKVAETGEIRGE